MLCEVAPGQRPEACLLQILIDVGQIPVFVA